MPKAPAGRPAEIGVSETPIRSTPTLDSLGIDKNVAKSAQVNLHRRHLSTSQKSIVAARARGIHDKAAKGRMKAAASVHKDENATVKRPEHLGGESGETAGVTLGLSGRNVSCAANILKKGVPEVIEALPRRPLL